MAMVVVLGAGRVGAAVARDLARDPRLRVRAVDARTDALERLHEAAARDGSAIRTREADLSDPRALRAAVEDATLVLGAVPGPMGFATARTVLEAGADIVDISFFEEDAFELDGLARARGRVAVVDAGVAPGLSNLILGHHEARLRETRRFECLVGGVPVDPAPPWLYRAPFSPIDVVAEYTRPARIRRGGVDVTVPALSELERVRLPGVGAMEAFNTDGLRTLLRTSRTPDLLEKTLRWPGHADRVLALRDSGFFDTEPIDVDGLSVAPIDLTARILFEAWRYRPDEEDMTIMRVVVDGRDHRGPVRHLYHLLDRHDARTGVSSMARTTGYTATAIARQLLGGDRPPLGLCPPERLAAATPALPRALEHLAARGIRVRHRTSRPHDPATG